MLERRLPDSRGRVRTPGQRESEGRGGYVARSRLSAAKQGQGLPDERCDGRDRPTR